MAFYETVIPLADQQYENKLVDCLPQVYVKRLENGLTRLEISVRGYGSIWADLDFDGAINTANALTNSALGKDDSLPS